MVSGTFQKVKSRYCFMHINKRHCFKECFEKFCKIHKRLENSQKIHRSKGLHFWSFPVNFAKFCRTAFSGTYLGQRSHYTLHYSLQTISRTNFIPIDLHRHPKNSPQNSPKIPPKSKRFFFLKLDCLLLKRRFINLFQFFLLITPSKASLKRRFSVFN